MTDNILKREDIIQILRSSDIMDEDQEDIIATMNAWHDRRKKAEETLERVTTTIEALPVLYDGPVTAVDVAEVLAAVRGHGDTP